MTWHPNPQLNAAIQRAVREGVNAYMLVFSRALRAQLSKPGNGRRYRVAQGKGKARNAREAGWHVASRPGSPPAVDTGMLRRSWQLGRSSLRGTVNPMDAAGGPGDGPSGGMSTGRRRGKVVSSTLGIIDANRRIGYRIGSAVKYARIEYGIGATAARPYVRPTIAAISDLFEPTMARALRRNLPPGGGAGAGAMRRG